MVDPASVNGRGTGRAPGSATAEIEGIAEFVDDLASLAELQAKLVALDWRETVRKSVIPIVLFLAGLAVFLAGVPVVLLGASWLLASALAIHQGWAMIVTAGSAMALAGLVAGWSGRRLGHSFDSFRRSQKQLKLNMAWIRTVLVTSARPHARRRL